jgi:hypothetical protein
LKRHGEKKARRNMAEWYVDPVREYLKRQHLEAEYEYRTAHKAIKRGAANYSEYERYEEELEQ